MKLPKESKFRRWKYLELARYVQGLDRVVREQDRDKKAKIFEWDDVEAYRGQHQNVGLYSSVFHYDDIDLDKATRLGSLYFDLDSADGGATALVDTRKLVEYLRQYVSDDALRVYFTGAKGFHVECEAIALGIGPANNLPGLFRYIANTLNEELALQTLDFHVYDLRRMWRLPNSQHQKTGLHKVDLGAEKISWELEKIQQYAQTPHFDIEVPDQRFEAKANEWYREWQYKQETKEQMTPEKMIERFNKFGSSVLIKEDPNTELEFCPDVLFEKCSAMMRHWETAETTHDLPHEARLFLCSILTYNKEAEWYLHQILSNCEDYNEEKSRAHIQDWIRRRELGIGGRPYSCDRANAAGVGCGQCELEPREKYQRIGDKLIKTGELSSPSPIRFAYKRKKKSEDT